MNRSPRKITCVDLFCGAGGLTHGLVKAGIQVKAGIDLDPACRYPFESNNPDAKFFEADVSKISSPQVGDYFDKRGVRLLAGCAPCQPFSTYSHRYDSKRDEKWELLNEFSRLVRGVKPEIVTMENVPALIKSKVFQDFVITLEKNKYQVWYDIVECGDYGVPQSRKRTVLLASRLGPICLIQPAGKKPITVRQAIGGFNPICAGEQDPKDKLHIAASLSPLNLKRIRASRPGGSWRDWPLSLRAECHQRNSGKTYPSVYGRMEWDRVGPTMTTQCYGYGNGRFGHPDQDRAISLREAAVLQSFPKGYKFVKNGHEVEFNNLGRLIGNAVPVKLGNAIGRSIVKHVEACR